MSQDMLMKHEEQITQQNVFMTCQTLAKRVEDTPEPRGSRDFISGFVSKPVDDHFFNDTKYLSAYVTSPVSKRSVLPCHTYYSQALTFIDYHFEIGDI